MVLAFEIPIFYFSFREFRYKSIGFHSVKYGMTIKVISQEKAAIAKRENTENVSNLCFFPRLDRILVIELFSINSIQENNFFRPLAGLLLAGPE